MKLINVKIYKYKCIQEEQSVNIEPTITTLVGMNESGKTSFLTAIAKTNYFDDKDPDFIFDQVHDYPRNEFIDFEEDEDDKGNIISCTYEIPEVLIKKINDELGDGVFTTHQFTQVSNYRVPKIAVSGFSADDNKFLVNISKDLQLSEETHNTISAMNEINGILSLQKNDLDVDFDTLQKNVADYLTKPDGWNNLSGYIYRKYVMPALPKFWYFDDYYPLNGKININKMINEKGNTEKDKTARALFELAKIDPKDILSAQDREYERFVALLEASSNKIAKEVFNYWKSNENLDIEFKIQSINNEQGQPEKYLDIRVRSQRHKISLPLDRRSKGFNWFFSFIVWFSRIQSDKKSDYILLLDEPGLNLHASAQADLLRFINDLSKKYQIIYTTHSPFMVESEHLDRIRTCLESNSGSRISDSIQEKDPNTLFPLQAALGYDIAQNLFISKKNLLVEGPADLIYLTFFSGLLQGENRNFLREDITIVPVGGLDKVTTFISLLRGSKLDVACLLDSFTDQKGKQKVRDLIMQKIIKEKNILFFDEFVAGNKSEADIEDLFEKEEYLKYFNIAFSGEIAEIKTSDLDNQISTTIKQINKVIGKDRFNHYRPANQLLQSGDNATKFSKETLDRFEAIFISINKLFNS